MDRETKETQKQTYTPPEFQTYQLLDEVIWGGSGVTTGPTSSRRHRRRHHKSEFSNFPAAGSGIRVSRRTACGLGNLSGKERTAWASRIRLSTCDGEIKLRKLPAAADSERHPGNVGWHRLNRKHPLIYVNR